MSWVCDVTLYFLPQHGSLTPLHIAAALPVSEGIQITETLLHVASDPNAGAEDENDVYDHDRVWDISAAYPRGDISLVCRR